MLAKVRGEAENKGDRREPVRRGNGVHKHGAGPQHFMGRVLTDRVTDRA